MAKVKLDHNTFTRSELDIILLEAGRRQMADPTNALVSREEILGFIDDAGYNLAHIDEVISVVLEQRQAKERRNSFIRRGIGVLAGLAVGVGVYFGVAYVGNTKIEARVLDSEMGNSLDCQMYGDHSQINVIDAKGTKYGLHFRHDDFPFDDGKFCDGVADLAHKIHEGSQIKFPQRAVENNKQVYLSYDDVEIVTR